MKLTISTSKGERLILPFQDELTLQQWDGFANTNHNLVTSKAPDQIGSTVINKIFNPRALNIQFVIRMNNRQEVFDKRREILSVLNPMYDDAVLKWEQNNGSVYKIDVRLDNIDMPGGDAQGNTFQLVQTTFLAEDPRWKDENITTVNLNINNNTGFINVGDTKTSCKIVIDGPITNPVIVNKNNGKKIIVNYDLLIDQQFIIETAFGEKNMLLVDEQGKQARVLNLLDLETEMFYLKQGDNNIEVKGLNTDVNTSATLEFYNRYIGV